MRTFFANNVSRGRGSRLIDALSATAELDTTLCLQVADSIQEGGV
jgi:hypothetical protein